MMGFIRGLIGLTLAILFAVFAVANRQDVDMVWSPTEPAAKIPLYIVALGMLALGFLGGSLMAWLGSVKLRWEKAAANRKVKALEKQLSEAKNEKIMIQPYGTAMADWTDLPDKDTE